MALDWGSLPFPTEYQEDGTLAMPLAGFADVRAVSLLGGAQAAAAGVQRTAGRATKMTCLGCAVQGHGKAHTKSS